MKNLKALRKNQNLSQSQVSSALGIPLTTYATYEQNKATPSENMLIKLADFFGCSVDYLLGHQINDPTRPKEATMLQRQLCQDILALDEDDCGRVEAYIAGIKAKNQEQQKIKKQYTQENS